MTEVQVATVRYGTWMVEGHMLRQSFDLTVSGRATRVVKDVACELADQLEKRDRLRRKAQQCWAPDNGWGAESDKSVLYGDKVFPWGLPYDVEVTGLEDGAVIVRSGLVNATEYAQIGETNRSMVSIDVLMKMGQDPEMLDRYYCRQEDVEEVIEEMSAVTIPSDREVIDDGNGGITVAVSKLHDADHELGVADAIEVVNETPIVDSPLVLYTIEIYNSSGVSEQIVSGDVLHHAFRNDLWSSRFTGQFLSYHYRVDSDGNLVFQLPAGTHRNFGGAGATVHVTVIEFDYR